MHCHVTCVLYCVRNLVDKPGCPQTSEVPTSIKLRGNSLFGTIRKGQMPGSSISTCTVVLLCLCIVLCLESNHLLKIMIDHSDSPQKCTQSPIYHICSNKVSLQWRCSQHLKISSSTSEAIECRNLPFCLFFWWVGRGSFQVFSHFVCE